MDTTAEHEIDTPTTTWPATPPARRRRRFLPAATAVVITIVLAMASVTQFGKSASSKFSSVASAICDTRMHDDGIVPRGVVAPPLAQFESACGGVSSPAASSSSGGGSGTRSAVPPTSARPSASAPAPTPAPTPDAAAGAASAATFGADALSPSPSAGHSFISTATMTVRIDGDQATIDQRKDEAIRRIETAGGALFAEKTSYSGDATATITMKVPPAGFREALSDLAALGVLATQDVNTDDVTQQVIDLDARITAAQGGVDRTRALLERATNLVDIGSLENDLARRETELEQLKGQQETLAQRVDLSTIVLTLTNSGTPAASTPTSTPPAPAAATPTAAKPLPGFMDGLQGGWAVFLNITTVVLAAFGAVLPFLPLVLFGYAALRLARRRRTHARGAPAAMAPGI